MTPRVLVRPPQPGDLRAIEAAEQICFGDPWPGHFFASEIRAQGRFQRILVGADGQLMAYLFAAWQYLDLHVLKVATLPPFRRLGLGRRLMELTADHVRETGGDSVTLEVRPTNAEAVEMYRALGYVEVGRRPRYYSDGEDALIMTLVVEPVPATSGSA